MGRHAMLFLAVIVLMTGANSAEPLPHEKTVRNLSVSVPQMPKAPTLDGTVDPAEWADAGMAPRLVLFERDDRLTDGRSHFYFGITDGPGAAGGTGTASEITLWFAWRIQRPKEAIAPKAIITQPDQSFWRTDDAIELMLNCTTAGRSRRAGRDYYLIWNARGTKYDRRELITAQQSADMQWTGDWQAVSRTVADFGWEGEARLPLAMLEGAERPGPGVHWRFQLAENRATPEPMVALAGFQLTWFEARDYPTLLFTGSEGVFVRVLDCGAMAESGRGGLVLEIVNPAGVARTVVPRLKFFRRKPDAPSSLPYLRAFDQARDRPEDVAGQGKVALFLPDEKLSQQLLGENYTLLKELKDPVTLQAGGRKVIDFTLAGEAGDYLVLYEVRYAEGQTPPGGHSLLAGGPLPFQIPEPLAVTTRNFFLVDRSIDVRADLRYVEGWDSGGAMTARFFPAGAPETALLERRWPGVDVRSRLEWDMPIPNAAAGKYTLHLTATDASGKKLAERQTGIRVPPTPEWFSRPAGQSPVIPPPWKPIRVSGPAKSPKLSFLMGDALLRDSALPSVIRVRSVFDDERQPILRGPTRLHGIVDGQTVEWRGRVKVKEKRAERVLVTSTAAAGNVAVSASAEFEYDGMEKVTLTLAPQAGSPAITRLTLSIPFVQGFADLYRPNRALLQPDKVNVLAGALPAEGLSHDWRPNVWIGNTRRGFEWFAENRRGWRTGGNFMNRVIEVENGVEGATLHVHFIRLDPAKPMALDGPREIVFGLMFTPPRTLNPHAVRHGIGYYATEHAEKLPGEIAGGLNCVEVWNHPELQGWPDQTPERTAELAAWGKRLHDRGVQVTPYSGWFISRKAQVYPTWGGEMVVEPLIDGGCGCDTVCWNTPVADAYLWQMRQAAISTGYDGFRMDAGFSVSPCSSFKHRGYGSVCGWRDEAGNVQPGLAIFAAREAAKRAYRMFHGDEITESGLCLHHIHGGCRIAAIMSHWDGVVSAEGLERTARTLKDFDLSFWRAAIMEDRSGLQVIYGPKTDTLGHDSRLAVGALHRLTVRGGFGVSIQEASYSRAARPAGQVWQAEDWVQWLDPGTEFLGYWENGHVLNTGHPEVYGSLHVRRGKKLLLALLNREMRPMERAVRLDLAALGFRGRVYGMDAVLHTPIEIRDGVFTVSLTAEGFRLVKIADRPFECVEPEKRSENLVPELDPSKWPAEGIPAGWTAGDAASAFSAAAGEIVIRGKADLPRQLYRGVTLSPDKHYVLEAEVRLECDNGVYLGPNAPQHHFGIAFGGFYYPLRTLGSQLLPGRYETFKIFASTTRDPGVSLRLWLNGDGKAFIRRIGVYEVDRVKPVFMGPASGRAQP
ncbi:MAG: hypothetical protein HYU36_23245 [Planctomycetes bacterium]|nr:hypothetical protein [Planctomycetota bacterium]